MKANLAIYYCSYPVILLTATALLARVLYLSGRVIATKRTPGEIEWMNRLLTTGLGVIAAGYLVLTVQTQNYNVATAQLMDMATIKLGFGLILLGLVFTFDLLVLAVWGRGGPRFARISELV